MFSNIFKYLSRFERDAGELQGAKRKCSQWWNIICSTSGWQNLFFSFKLLIGWGIEMLMSSFMVLRYNWIQRKNCGLLVSYMLHQSLEKGRKAKMGLAS